MALFGSPILQDIQEIIKERQEIQTQKNMDKYLKWNSRIPWVRLFSNAIPNIDNNLASKYILEGAPSSTKGDFNTSYIANVKDLNIGIPYRAHPIIKDFSIITKGKYGSLRQANINIKCFSIEQLQDIELLYMTPGITCLLQWGFSIDSKGEPVVGGINYNDINILDNYTPGSIEFLNYVNKIRKENNFALDILWGYITNFGYTLESNGAYSIQLEMTAAGFEAAYRKNEDAVETIQIKQAKNDKEKRKNLKNKTKQLKSYFSDKDKMEELVGEDKDLIPIKINNEIYLPWGFIEKYIISGCVSIKNNNISIGNFESTYIDNTTKQIKPITIRNHKNLISMDPLKFIIPGQPFLPMGCDNYFATNDNENISGYLKYLLINLDVVLEAFNSKELVYDSVNEILEILNTYSCNYWDLIIIPDSYEGKCKIIDSHWIDNLSEPFIFNTYTYDSILYPITLSSSIPDSYKTTALYTLNSVESGDNAMSIKGLFGDVKDRILLKIKEDKNVEQTNTDINIENNKERNKFHGYLDKYKYDKNNKIQLKDIPDNLWEYQKERLKESNNKGNQDASIYANRIIPINLSITIDGVSGLEFGNTFLIDYLPSRYTNEKIRFQIVEVKEEVNKSSWKTTINGIMRFIGKDTRQYQYTPPKPKDTPHNNYQGTHKSTRHN